MYNSNVRPITYELEDFHAGDGVEIIDAAAESTETIEALEPEVKALKNENDLSVKAVGASHVNVICQKAPDGTDVRPFVLKPR